MGNHTLLIADDNPSSLKLMRAIFTSDGYNVISARDGQEAFDQLLMNQVDLIITDVLMPNVDGYYLCYKVRTHKKLKEIPIIVYTATFTSFSEEKVAKDMGANLFIRKPAPLNVLLDSVKEVLQKSEFVLADFHAPDKKIEVMHQYSSNLVNKLEQRNIELEEALSALKQTVSRFRQAQQIGHLGHWEYDFKTKRSTWSSEMFAIFGLNPENTKPSLELLVKHIHKDERAEMKQLINESIKNLSPFSRKHRIVAKGKEIKSILSVGQFEFSNSLAPLRLYGISLDITELTEKEKKLERANRELETFIYKAYHDLRSPIVTVQGLTNIAALEIKDEVALSYFKMIGDIAIKQNKMLLKLMKVMNIRDQEPVITSFKINEVIDEVIESLKPLKDFSRFKINIFNELTDPIHSDRELVMNIIHNLVENSVLYYNADRSDSEITISAGKSDGNAITIEIEDNGIGIPEEVKQSVFDLFFRGTPVSKGAGLGLFLVRNAVEKLGGTINLSTYEAMGSTFSVIIPDEK